MWRFTYYTYVCIRFFAIQTEYLVQLIIIMLCVNSCVKTFKFQAERQEYI